MLISIFLILRFLRVFARLRNRIDINSAIIQVLLQKVNNNESIFHPMYISFIKETKIILNATFTTYSVYSFHHRPSLYCNILTIDSREQIKRLLYTHSETVLRKNET